MTVDNAIEKIRNDTKFCVDCGTQIHTRAEICPSCGIRQPLLAPPIEEVSDWWWALPIFFGFLGGVIGWLGVRNRDPQKARKMLITGIFLSVLIWLLLIA